MSKKVLPTRTVFTITYLLDNAYPLNRDDLIEAEIALFYFNAFWDTDDDLARKISSIIEQELGENILLMSWRIDD